MFGKHGGSQHFLMDSLLYLIKGSHFSSSNKILSTNQETHKPVGMLTESTHLYLQGRLKTMNSFLQFPLIRLPFLYLHSSQLLSTSLKGFKPRIVRSMASQRRLGKDTEQCAVAVWIYIQESAGFTYCESQRRRSLKGDVLEGTVLGCQEDPESPKELKEISVEPDGKLDMHPHPLTRSSLRWMDTVDCSETPTCEIPRWWGGGRGTPLLSQSSE